MTFLTALDAPALRAAGIPEPWSYGRADKVRFGEIDALGHVNNVAYFRWFETLRVNYLQDYGVHDYTSDAPRPRIVVKQVTAEYHAELMMADYIACARTVEMRRTSFTQHYALFADGGLKTTGSAVVVFLNEDGSKMPLPDTFRETLLKRDSTIQAGPQT